MKKIAFIVLALSTLVACKKNDTDMVVKSGTPFTIKVNQTATLESDGLKITLLEITEDSRCPTTAECIWAGRIVAEFKVEKDGDSQIKTLSDNPSGDPTLSDQFEAFGHLVKLVEATPQVESSPIAQGDYVFKIEVE
ncbi:MAG: hypothetical protein IT258_02765 [Saprospiraceae bacterium]|nr:hypothetical protein [Saprospiraceae bacterium]